MAIELSSTNPVGCSTKKNNPVGLRFNPTDAELVKYYLEPKIMGNALENYAITEIDFYKSEPWELPQKSKRKSEDRVWWFLCKKEYRNLNKKQRKRTTKTGYWKSTGQDREIKDDNSKVCIGMKKTLVFHIRSTNNRTNWVMQEIYLNPSADISSQMNSYVICKLMKKSDEKVETLEGEIHMPRNFEGISDIDHFGLFANLEPNPSEVTDHQDSPPTQEIFNQGKNFSNLEPNPSEITDHQDSCPTHKIFNQGRNFSNLEPNPSEITDQQDSRPTQKIFNQGQNFSNLEPNPSKITDHLDSWPTQKIFNQGQNFSNLDPNPSKITDHQYTWQEIYLNPSAYISSQMNSYVICKLKKKSDEKTETPEGEIPMAGNFEGISAIDHSEIILNPESHHDSQFFSLTLNDFEQFRILNQEISSQESAEEFTNSLIVDPTIEVSSNELSQSQLKRRYLSDTDAQGENKKFQGSGCNNSRVARFSDFELQGDDSGQNSHLEQECIYMLQGADSNDTRHTYILQSGRYDSSSDSDDDATSLNKALKVSVRGREALSKEKNKKFRLPSLSKFLAILVGIGLLLFIFYAKRMRSNNYCYSGRTY